MITTFTGYHLRSGVAPEDLDNWLRTKYAQHCLAQPSLSALIFNHVEGTLRVDRSFYGIEERQFTDLRAFEAFTSWQGLEELERVAAEHRRPAFSVLTSVVSLDRTNMDEMIGNPSARRATTYDQPKEKSVLGYDIVPGMTVREYEAWLWDIHTPDLFANPHLGRVVFNTVQRKLGGEETFFRISELHIAEDSSFDAWAKWRDQNPVPAERSPLGRTAFRFFVRTSVEALLRQQWAKTHLNN